MTNTTKTNTARASRYAAEAYADWKQIDGYVALLAVAEAHGMEYEVDRIKRAIAELEESAEEAQLNAIAHGYDPDLD